MFEDDEDDVLRVNSVRKKGAAASTSTSASAASKRAGDDMVQMLLRAKQEKARLKAESEKKQASRAVAEEKDEESAAREKEMLARLSMDEEEPPPPVGFLPWAPIPVVAAKPSFAWADAALLNGAAAKRTLRAGAHDGVVLDAAGLEELVELAFSVGGATAKVKAAAQGTFAALVCRDSNAVRMDAWVEDRSRLAEAGMEDAPPLGKWRLSPDALVRLWGLTRVSLDAATTTAATITTTTTTTTASSSSTPPTSAGDTSTRVDAAVRLVGLVAKARRLANASAMAGVLLAFATREETDGATREFTRTLAAVVAHPGFDPEQAALETLRRVAPRSAHGSVVEADGANDEEEMFAVRRIVALVMADSVSGAKLRAELACRALLWPPRLARVGQWLVTSSPVKPEEEDAGAVSPPPPTPPPRWLQAVRVLPATVQADIHARRVAAAASADGGRVGPTPISQLHKWYAMGKVASAAMRSAVELERFEQDNKALLSTPFQVLFMEGIRAIDVAGNTVVGRQDTAAFLILSRSLSNAVKAFQKFVPAMMLRAVGELSGGAPDTRKQTSMERFITTKGSTTTEEAATTTTTTTTMTEADEAEAAADEASASASSPAKARDEE